MLHSQKKILEAVGRYAAYVKILLVPKALLIKTKE
jgi:hypothetical protein